MLLEKNASWNLILSPPRHHHRHRMPSNSSTRDENPACDNVARARYVSSTYACRRCGVGIAREVSGQASRGTRQDLKYRKVLVAQCPDPAWR
jgi:hypothetical protein